MPLFPPADATEGVIRNTWLPRNSSEETRSEYREFESLSREFMRDSVVGTSKTWQRIVSINGI